MRIRRFLPLTLAAMIAFSGTAQAGAVTYHGVHYIFAQEEREAAFLTLTLSAESVDARTLETESVSQLAGAVFGVYARGADGELVPYPDPKNPALPLTLTTQTQPVSAALPGTAELYLCQLSAPEGYAMALTEPLAVSAPCEIALSCRRLGETGVRAALCGDAASGPVPLAGVEFTLENADASYAAETDENGVALFTGVAPGEYTLVQRQTAGAFSIDSAEHAVTVREGELSLVEITNSRPGTLTLSVSGLSCDRETGATRLVPLKRTYDVFDASGARVGSLGSGDALELPAAQQGTRYVLRAAGGEEDGFAADGAEHEALLFSGAVCPAQALLNSTAGYVDFEQTDAEGAPAAGGVFALYDASGAEALRFEAGADGRCAPSEPLAAGEYTLRMVRAAEGRPYSEEEVAVTVAPYLPEKKAASARFVSPALPQALTNPQIGCETAQLPSLFEQDAEVSVALRAEGLPAEIELRFEVELPTIAGLTGEIGADGTGTLRLARRFALPGTEEIRALTLTGTVRYAFEYPVDADGTRETRTVAAPFSATLAAFAAAENTNYAVSGRLTGENGEPLAGREVSLLGADGAALETVVTDPAGAYAFAREGVVSVRADEGCGVRYIEGGAQMLPLQTVKVRVEGGEDARGARVTLRYGSLGAQSASAGETAVFTGLPEADDALTVEAPEGILYKTESAADGATVRLYAAASVAGAVRDPDGAPVAGATVTLGGETRVTGADGAFAFENLYPGEYALETALPEGWLRCGEAETELTLNGGEARALEITAMRPARVEGALTEEGKPVAGVIVRLAGQETETGEDGRFVFENLTAGAFALTFEAPEGMAVQGVPEKIEIAHSGETVRLSLEAIRAASAAGTVWHDADNNGLRSAAEPGLSGAQVTLLDGDGGKIVETTTGSDGAFSFEGLLPGEYRIAVTLPENMIFSRETEGMERLISGHDSREGESAPFTLASGEKKTGLLCGAVVSGRVEGLVFEDRDGSGAEDGAKAPLKNAVVTLEQDGKAVQSVTTGADGRYAFEHLRSGDYTLRAALPDGMLSTTGETAEISVRTWRTQFEKNFGGVRPAEIRVMVFCDETADGARQANEPALSGASVSLVTGEGARETVVAAAETDEAGEVRFENVYPGSYRLRAEREGWALTAGPETLTVESGESIDAGLIGLTELGSVSGRTFTDEDYDGLRGETEKPASATVTLLDGAGNALASTRTDANGAYRFDGLKAGKYAVAFELPEGWQFTRSREDAPSYNSDVPETSENQARTAAIYLPMGEELPVDAGGYRAAKLSGAVWMYPNGNDGAANVPVRLMRGGEVYRETETDARGAYAFDALPPGEYTVEPVLPDGLLVMNETAANVTLAMGETRGGVRFAAVQAAALRGTIGDEGANLSLRSEAGEVWECGDVGTFAFEGLLPGEYTLSVTPAEGWALCDYRQETQTFTLEPGETLEMTFETRPEAVVSGSVWYDENGDGSAEGEAPLEGAAVTLYLAADGQRVVLRTARTGADGTFRFAALAPGEYALAFASDDAALRFEETEAFTLREGDAKETPVAAWKPVAVSGEVWDDKNADGLRRQTEPALEGVRVELMNAAGETACETATDANGAYAFENLRPGEMSVRFTLAEGCVFTDYNESGSLVPTTDANVGRTEPFALRAGETRANVSAGSLTAGRVGDRVWLDENGNGLQDSGEPGVENVTVILLRVAADYTETEAARTVTDANGRYRFSAVRPGTYRVRFELPEGCAPTVQAPKFPAINSKLDAESKRPELTESFQVRSGEAYLAADAGLVKP